MITYRLTYKSTLEKILAGTKLFTNVSDVEEESLMQLMTQLITHLFFDNCFDFHNNLLYGKKIVFVKLDNYHYVETISQDELNKTYFTIKKLMMLK